MAKHAICHIEWASTDLDRSKAFLAGLFGWEIKPWGEGYLTCKPPEGVGAGIMKVDRVEPGQTPLVYVEVEEIEPYLDKAKQLGGGVAVGKTEIPKLGWFAHLTDPDGGIVGLFQGGGGA